ncbi:hypothetical protein VSDG_08920 [Cytospora chrysosperma]|uniref:Uncharacterized protein n=1 Tax=Cytospora chrysosperma TaxID=252740 RepID=A0A423VDB0_CYTCH|nr:hypothetical protein VSDG_08920 [Valsa sordida]
MAGKKSRREHEDEVRSWGFNHVFTWTDGPHAHYSPHSHAGLTTHLILSGQLTVTYPEDENPTKETFGVVRTLESDYCNMSNLKKTYFLCPNWDYHPDGPVQLGNIIMSPENPAQALNDFERHPPTQSSIFPATTKSGVTWTKEKSHSVKYGLWTEFLSFISGLGVDASVDHNVALKQTFSFDSISTTEFSPTPEYLIQSMSAPAVVDYIKKSRFNKHVYMITALKIVRGAKAEIKHERSIEGQLGATLDGTSSGVPLSGGPGIGGKRNDRDITSFEGSSDFVFAYRLRKWKA